MKKLVGYTQDQWWREGLSGPVPEEYKLREVFVEEAEGNVMPPSCGLMDTPGYTENEWTRLGLSLPVPENMKYVPSVRGRNAVKLR